MLLTGKTVHSTKLIHAMKTFLTKYLISFLLNASTVDLILLLLFRICISKIPVKKRWWWWGVGECAEYRISTWVL